MGTRYFSAVEKKDSNIKWIKADQETTQKLTKAINKYANGIVSAKVARVVVFVSGIVLLGLLIVYLYFINNNYTKIGFNAKGFFILFTY